MRRLDRATIVTAAIAIVALFAACRPGDQPEFDSPRSLETNAMLHVALQEGFDDDRVELRVNEASIYQRDSVTTDLRIGRADAVEMEMGAGPHRLTVSLPERNISDSIDVRGDAPVYVGVSLVGESVQFTVSDQPFGYL